MAQGNHKNTTDPATGFDPTIQTEKLAFDPCQMVRCSSCERSNPPNRLGCLYCGAVLEVDQLETSALKTGLRRADVWQHGFNLVSIPRSYSENVDVTRAADVLLLEEKELKAILQTPLPMPLCRVETENDAAAVSKVLARLGLESRIVSDQALSANKPPIRLAGIGFLERQISMISFNSREESVMPAADIVLMVKGLITVSKVDQIEKRRRSGVSRFSGEVSTISDEPILDIYASNDTVGFRIQTSGFDFSCLGAEKGLLAADNLEKLINKLAAASTNAKLVTEYRSLRQAIGSVWEVEMRRETKGLQYTGLGKREFGSVASTSNLDQFTKFSRLQRHLL